MIERRSIEIEHKPKVRIIIPEGWGEGELESGVDSLLLRCLGSAAKQEVGGRLQAEREIRELMHKMGFEIVVKKSSEQYVENGSDFVVIGKKDEIGDELQEVREVVPNIKIPETLTVEQFNKNPFFPVMAVFEGLEGGIGKYLLEDKAQWDLFKKFLENEGRQLKEEFLMKRFIPTPSDRFTSYRIIVSAKGTIMASALLYSGRKKSDSEVIKSGTEMSRLGKVGSDLLDYLEVKGSPYFLGAKDVTSNIGQGGGCIPLNPEESSRQISGLERQILDEHGINADSKLPPEIAKQAEAIGSHLGKKMGLLVGLDFILDSTDGSVYYLEANAEPGMQTYLAVKNNGQGTEADGYRMAMEEALLDLAVEMAAPAESSRKKPEMTPAELREKMRDPSFLPTREQFFTAFETAEQWRDYRYDEEKPVFEMLTEEYVSALTNYLAERFQHYSTNDDKQLVVLEVGAGNGRLTHFLQQKLEEKIPGGIKIIATDPGSDEWSIKPDFDVEKIDYKAAIDKYKPTVVICSWMEHKQDLTADFRKAESLKEYILIGEVDSSTCSDPWATWGKPKSLSDKDIPPYKVDGFEKIDLDQFEGLQICRTDLLTDLLKNYTHSHTVPFRRRE